MNNPTHLRYKIIAGTGEHFFFLDSTSLDDDIAFINQHHVCNIQINPNFGYDIQTIEPLFKINKIEKLYLHISNTNLDNLNKLKEHQVLSINSVNHNINLSGLINLTELSLQYQKNIRGLDSLIKLQLLNIIKSDVSFFNITHFKHWPNLKFFQALSAKLPNDLSFLNESKELKHIEIHNCRTTFNIESLVSVRDTLEELAIGNCKKVEGLDVLKNLSNLKRLSFSNSSPLANADFVENLKKLEILVVVGASYFTDGNTSHLKNKIKYLSLDNKKHYC